MADEKISHLVSTKPAGPLTVADGFEVSQTLSTVPATKGAVFSQLVTLLQTAFPSLSWASGVSNLQPNGDVFVGAGNLAIINAADGSASFGATKILLNSDGSASFASGGITIGATGGIQSAVGATFGNSNIILNDDGSMNIANGSCQIAVNGSLTVDDGSGAVKLNSATGSVDVSGNKVVGAQGAPVADATTAVDVIARFNELLARVRASTGHGLISG